jgi:DNA-binding transcriptional LysR family regulator
MRWHLPTEAEFEFLHDLRLTFLASRDHPLVGRGCISVDDIAEAGLITAPFIGAEAGFYREVLREFGLTGDHSVIEVDGLQTRFLATAAGLGVMATFIPDHAREVVFTDLAPLDVEGRPTTVQVGLVRRSDNPGSSTTDELAAWLRKLSAP